MSNIVVNGTNVGTELQQLILLADTGVSINANLLGHLKEINAVQQTTKVIITPVLYGGRRIHRNIYHDFIGNMSFSRFNGDLTNLILGIINRFQQQSQETYFTIYATIFNSILGTTDEYAFQRCVLDDHDIGRWTGTAEVDQPLGFRCQTLIQTGAGVNVLQNGPSLSP